MNSPLISARDLITRARALYPANRPVIEALTQLERRLAEPLRVALVGSVKAGKSTLLNGLLGERIAPTDARESTRIVTWYHHGPTPRVRARLTAGESVSLPAKRQHERLELDLQGIAPEDCERLDVMWPAPGLEGITLIDTPGIASVSQEVSDNTHKFLLPEQGAAGADAVVYLLRSLHESDIRYMQALAERTRHGSASMGAIAVLSRADELGSGRLTAMMSINDAVERLRAHPELQGACETVVPVAGLMGMGAMSLRQADFTVFADLASRDTEETRRLLVTAERFITSREGWLPPERTRIDLVDRFGMYGIRIALAVLRGGVMDASGLAAELLRRSGLDELRRVIDVHFRQRQEELKAHSIVFALHQLLRRHPVPGSTELLVAADEHMARAHTFTEMQLVGRLAAGNLNLPPTRIAELERLIGGRGSADHVRLGFDDGVATPAELRELALEQLERWRELARNPLFDRDTHRACEVAERSCEAIVVRLSQAEVGEAGASDPRIEDLLDAAFA